MLIASTFRGFVPWSFSQKSSAGFPSVLVSMSILAIFRGVLSFGLMIFNSLKVKFPSAVLLMGRGTMQPADGVETGQMAPVAAGMVRLRDDEGWKVMDGRCRTDGTAAGWMARLRTYGTAEDVWH